MSRERPTQIFTPPHVARWLAQAASPVSAGVVRGSAQEHSAVPCLDPCAGDGRLLLAWLEQRCAHGADPRQVVEEELLGFEIDPVQAETARQNLVARALALGALGAPSPRVLTGDALAAPLPAAQAVLLNPPYGNADRLPATFHEGLVARFGFHRRQLDRAAFFIAAAVEALVPHGRLAAIVPRYWLEATGAAEFRAWLAHHAEIEALIDLGNHQVWPDAEVLTALLVLSRPGEPSSRDTSPSGDARPEASTRVEPSAAQAPKARFWRAPDGLTGDALEQRLWSRPGIAPGHAWSVSAARLDRRPWNVLPPRAAARLEALEAACVPLSDVFDVGQGLKTGADKVFVMDRRQAQARGLPAELLVSTVAPRDVGAYTVREADRVMLRLLNSHSFEALPQALRGWLEEHRETLEGRYQARHGVCRWYALSLPQNLSLMARSPKILVPLYARENRFAVDRRGHHVGTGVYVLAPGDALTVPLEGIVAWLNSAPLRRVAAARAKLKRAGYREYGRRLLAALPLPLTVAARRVLTAPQWRALRRAAPSPLQCDDDPWEALAQVGRHLERASSSDVAAWRSFGDRVAEAWCDALIAPALSKE